MRISIHRPDPDKPTLRIRALATEGGVSGDVSELVNPGDNFLGWTYPELLAMGNGMHDLAAKRAPRLWPGESEN